MNFVYSVSWKVYCKKSKKLIACVLEGDKPLTIKNRGRWWVFFGSTGFQRCDFNFEECKEYVIIESPKCGDEPEMPKRVVMGMYLDRIKTLEDLLK